MKRDRKLKPGANAWVVTSGVRMLPASLRRSLTYALPLPRPVVSNRQRRPYSPPNVSLVPLSRRAVVRDR